MTVAILLLIAAILLFGAAAIRNAMLGALGALVLVAALAFFGYRSGVNPMFLLLGMCIAILVGGGLWRLLNPESFKQFEEMRRSDEAYRKSKR